MNTKTLSSVSEALKAAFPPGLEQYRCGPAWQQDGARFTRPLAYIDARAVFERLDEVVGPDGWATELERVSPGVYVCRMTVLGVTRSDVGQAGDRESEQEKAGVSDAIKRVAVQFGIGRYLYETELPPVKLERRGEDWVLPRGWRPASPGLSIPARPAPASGSTATSKQLAKITAELKRIKWDDDTGRAYLLKAFGKRSRTELTSREASEFIDHLVGIPA